MRTDQAIRPTNARGTTPSTSRRGTWRVVLTSTAIVALVVAGLATLAWRGGAADTDRAIEARDAALERVAALTDRVDRLEEDLGTDVPSLQARLDASREALRRARAELGAIAGPALPDGRHLVRIVSIGEDQRPARVVVDLMQWFTDQAAVDAALADGVPPGDAGIDGFYIRNASPRWRIAELDAAAPVALTTYPHGEIDDPGIVDLARFSSWYETSDDALRYSPYWITVRDGTVVRIEEQYTP